ncbi:5-carboxymethyl-2-hydroxymuconate isomerase [Pseudoalteromonas sp. YIC-656]|uniref:5-carboxymethyl-2-hydroxymuconate Delta-isomerase n=1 Tax=Pseudoalteromonas pernae TaxID=3118054 RepID=UPI003242129E
MPHFVIHCSNDILTLKVEHEINSEIHHIAHHSQLFEQSDIKVRVMPFNTYSVGGETASFIHVFANIMQGRTIEQRSHLSQAIVAKLVAMFPEVPHIAMNVDEFEKSTYCNKALL